MPGGDGTGPMGAGPMTGRAAGYCAGYGTPGYANPIRGRAWGGGRFGFGAGAGRGFGGRGWRNRFYATGVPGWARAGGYAPYAYGPPASPEAELEMLQAQEKQLADTLENLRKRVEQIQAEVSK